MKFFKNIALGMLIATMPLSASMPVYAKQINNITEYRTSARVLQVLSGDSFLVELPNKDRAYVKIRGITTDGFNESYNFLVETLLGQTVTLDKDGTSYVDGRFNYMNVYLNNLNIADEMIKLGYAIIDKTQTKSGYYNTFLASQDEAKKNYSGMWVYENPKFSTITGIAQENPATTNDKININTASKSQLKTLLKGLSDNTVQNIIYYREQNPFSYVQEIKFVGGFTKKMYDDNKIALTVRTNINTANEFELRTLGLSEDEIKQIITARNKQSFTAVSNLKQFIDKNLYYKIEPFVSVENVSTIVEDTGLPKANISLSGKDALTKAGAPYKVARNLVDNRAYGYTYKTLHEISRISDTNYVDMDYLEDNLDVYTDINTNNKDELISIFGDKNGQKIYEQSFSTITDLQKIITANEFEKVKANVYAKTLSPEYININTATEKQMLDAGLHPTQINIIMQNRPIYNTTQLRVDVTNINDKISMYTNINTASEKELKSLNNNITDLFIDKLIKRRKEEIFGSIEEVEDFFNENNAPLTFKYIKQFLVVR